MNIRLILLSICCSVLILASCDTVKKEHDRVMDLHDSSMLKMSELAKCMKALEKDSTENAQSVFDELKQAEDDMWKWMHNYEEPKETSPKEDKLKYFAEQYTSIKKVDNDIDASIAKAKEIIKQ